MVFKLTMESLAKPTFSSIDTEKWLNDVNVPSDEAPILPELPEELKAKQSEEGGEEEGGIREEANTNNEGNTTILSSPSPPQPARLDTASPDLYSADDVVMTSSPVLRRSSQDTAVTAPTANAAEQRPLPPSSRVANGGKRKGKAMSPMEIDFIQN